VALAVVGVGLVPASPARSADALGDCVVDLPQQVKDLKRRPELLGAHLTGNRSADGADIEATLTKHHQGIVRVDTPLLPYFHVSLSRESPSDFTTGADGRVLTLAMASKKGQPERLRSNRVSQGARPWSTPPDRSLDRLVVVPATRGYTHAGGMQASGRNVVVGLEERLGSALAPGEPERTLGAIAVYEASAGRLSELYRIPVDQKIGAASMVRYSATEWIVTGYTGTSDVVGFVVEGSLEQPATTPRRLPSVASPWRNETNSPITDPTLTPQHVSLLRGCSGKIYALATRRTTAVPVLGLDFIDLYQVEVSRGTDFKINGLTYSFLGSKLMSCQVPGAPADEEVCNFAAAAGTHVTPSGELIIYAAPHVAQKSQSDVLQIAEFGSSRGYSSTNTGAFSPRLDPNPSALEVPEGATTRLPDPNGSDRMRPRYLPPAARAWADLYEDANYGGESLTLGYGAPDGGFPDLRKQGFDDKITSLRWMVPTDCNLELFADLNFSPRNILATGTLAQIATGPDTRPAIRRLEGKLDNKITSVRLSGSGCAGGKVTALWRTLDGAATEVFDATDIDGPTESAVRFVAVSNSWGGRDSVVVPVKVRNVPPKILSVRAFATGPRLEVTVQDVDPVTVSGAIITPSGSRALDRRPVGAGRRTISYRVDELLRQGTRVRVTAEDDDGGIRTYAEEAQVLLQP
jgi:hypothetical protein